MRDPKERDDCLAEVDELYKEERKLLYITQCTCEGAVIAEKEQTIAICEAEFDGRYYDRCVENAEATQETAI